MEDVKNSDLPYARFPNKHDRRSRWMHRLVLATLQRLSFGWGIQPYSYDRRPTSLSVRTSSPKWRRLYDRGVAEYRMPVPEELTRGRRSM